MIGFTLGRYFFRRFVMTTVWYVLGIFSIAYIVDFTEFTNRTGSLPKFDAVTALAVSAMRIPTILQIAIPFIILFSAMTTLMNFNRKYELVIARSAGVSAWQFLAPALVGAFVVGIVTVLVINPLAAAGYARADLIEGDWRARPSSFANWTPPSWISQSTAEGDAIIGAAKVANEGGRLFGAVFLLFDTDGNIRERMDAETADLKTGRWILTNVTTTRDGGSPVRTPSAEIPSNLDPLIVEESLARPEGIPFYKLPAKIAAARTFGVSANPFAMQFHSLMALPALLVAMTLIAATVSLRFARFGQSGPMILGGILAGFVLYVVSVLVKSFGSAGIIPPPVAAWLPVLAATMIGVGFLLHREDG